MSSSRVSLVSPQVTALAGILSQGSWNANRRLFACSEFASMFSSIDGTLFSLRNAKKSITRKDQTRPVEVIIDPFSSARGTGI